MNKIKPADSVRPAAVVVYILTLLLHFSYTILALQYKLLRKCIRKRYFCYYCVILRASIDFSTMPKNCD